MFARERRELTGDVSAMLDREGAEQLDAWRRWVADLLAGGGFRTVLLVGLFGCILLSCLVFTVFKCCKVRFTQFKFLYSCICIEMLGSVLIAVKINLLIGLISYSELPAPLF